MPPATKAGCRNLCSGQRNEAGQKWGILIIADQNWGGVKKVHECEMDPAGLKSGEMMFYRPE